MRIFPTVHNIGILEESAVHVDSITKNRETISKRVKGLTYSDSRQNKLQNGRERAQETL